MNKSTWTLFGVGNFIYDVVDAIGENNGIVRTVVLNQKLDKVILEKIPSKAEIIDIKDFRPKTTFYFFGFMELNKEPLIEQLTPYNLIFPNLIHPFSSVSPTAQLGKGNFVGAGAVIGPHARLGNFNIVNRMASIGHESKAGSLNHFGPGAVVTGQCTIGNKNFFGANATVTKTIMIGNGITLGAGAVAVKNISKQGVYAGVPARPLKK